MNNQDSKSQFNQGDFSVHFYGLEEVELDQRWEYSEPKLPEVNLCECGAQSVNSDNHSHYCPLNFSEFPE